MGLFGQRIQLDMVFVAVPSVPSAKCTGKSNRKRCFTCTFCIFSLAFESCKCSGTADYTGKSSKKRCFTCTFYIIGLAFESCKCPGTAVYTGKSNRKRCFTCTFCIFDLDFESCKCPGTANYTGKTSKKAFLPVCVAFQVSIGDRQDDEVGPSPVS